MVAIAMSNGEGVTYTVKELIAMLEDKLVEQLGGITSRLDKIDGKIDDKASNTRVLALEERVATSEGRINKLELGAAGDAAVTTFQRWLFGTVAVGILGAVATLVWLASGGH